VVCACGPSLQQRGCSSCWATWCEALGTRSRRWVSPKRVRSCSGGPVVGYVIGGVACVWVCTVSIVWPAVWPAIDLFTMSLKMAKMVMDMGERQHLAVYGLYTGFYLRRVRLACMCLYCSMYVCTAVPGMQRPRVQQRPLLSARRLMCTAWWLAAAQQVMWQHRP
jgi:hypothetical protein